jgi:argininosuccinate lyase
MSNRDANRSGTFWVIGGGLLQIPLLEEVERLGLQTIVSDADPSCACAKRADHFLPIDIFDIGGHLDAADRLRAEGVEIGAVLAAGIDAPETMARVCAHLGLPSVAPDVARLVNHKDLFRLRMVELGYPMPRFQTISKDTFHQLPKLLREVGFPLIVKNTCSSGSRGTRIFEAENLHEIEETVQQAIAVSRSGRALIEELWSGPEQTVETLFDCNGRFHPCFITDRQFDKSDGYALEIGLRHPTTLAAAQQAELYGLAESVAHDLGIHIGAVKLDTILTHAGPRIIEMTVRLSGGFDCQYLVPAATGKNVLRAAVLTALGREFPAPLLEATRQRVGLSGSIFPRPGLIVSIEGVEEARQLPGVHQIFFRHAVGDRIDPYIDCTKRVCFLIVSGESETDAQRTLDAARKCIQIHTIEDAA